MFELIKKHNREPLYKQIETEIIFNKFKGGFSWPGSKPAFISVIGQEDSTGILRVCATIKESEMLGLARSCAYLQSICNVDHWVAVIEGPKQSSYEDFFDQICREADLQVYLHHPTLVQDLNLALQVLVREELRKTLILGDFLRDRISELRQMDLAEPGLEEKFPEVLTLANVVYEFEPPDTRAQKFIYKDAWEDDLDDEQWLGL